MSELAFTVELTDGTVVAAAADQAQAVNLAAAFAISDEVHVYDTDRTEVAWAGVPASGVPAPPLPPLDLSADVDPENSQHFTFMVAGSQINGVIDFGDSTTDVFAAGSAFVEHVYAEAGNYYVTAEAGEQNAEIYVDVSPAPEKPLHLDSISPDTVEIGTNDIVLTCTGSGFEAGAAIIFGANAERTDYLSESEVTTIVKPTLFLAPDDVPVSVQNPDGSRTGELTFTFTAAAPPEE